MKAERTGFEWPEDNNHPRAMELRRKIVEALAFGKLNWDVLNEVFMEVNARFHDLDTCVAFIDAKEMAPEFAQFIETGESE